LSLSDGLVFRMSDFWTLLFVKRHWVF